jgi:CRISPR/Cas system-associated endonuclease Cas1
VLTRDIAALAARSGLHPGFGFQHEPRENGDAFAYDMTEVFRAPLAEGLAQLVHHNGAFRQDMFAPGRAGGLSLFPHGHAALIRNYKYWLGRPIRSPHTSVDVAWRELIEQELQAFARSLLAASTHAPYTMKA